MKAESDVLKVTKLVSTKQLGNDFKSLKEMVTSSETPLLMCNLSKIHVTLLYWNCSKLMFIELNLESKNSDKSLWTDISKPLWFQSQTEDVWMLLWEREAWKQGHPALRRSRRTGRASDCPFIHWLTCVTACAFCWPAQCQPQWGEQRRMWWPGPFGEGMLIRTLSTRLWTVLFILNPWPQLDASPLRGSYEVAEWFSKLIHTLDEHSHCLTTPLETTKLYENVRNVRYLTGSADVMREKSEAAHLLYASPPTLYPCPSWQGHLTADWGTERLFSPHAEWPNLTARADLRPSRPLQQAEEAFWGCESACCCWWLHCQRRHPGTSPHPVGSRRA